ncbi:hypothetical protein QUB63_11785 [Microcoleus sp. ARI1-B5]|uniref:hypothetical protein n=1 Tax=Microcoleus sp. ARI1-A1 TaxID=2818556 RepID=UPI002FD1B566
MGKKLAVPKLTRPLFITHYPLPERIGLKPKAFSGEIKRRLFITPILGLPGRGRPLAVNPTTGFSGKLSSGQAVN